MKEFLRWLRPATAVGWPTAVAYFLFRHGYEAVGGLLLAIAVVLYTFVD